MSTLLHHYFNSFAHSGVRESDFIQVRVHPGIQCDFILKRVLLYSSLLIPLCLHIHHQFHAPGVCSDHPTPQPEQPT
jgi:hypothetical protein